MDKIVSKVAALGVPGLVLIIAVSANIAGETTAMYINNLLKDKHIEVFRIG